MPAGYSGSPLPKKLGIKAHYRVATQHEPTEFRELLADLPAGVSFTKKLNDEADVVIGFFTESKRLEADLVEIEQAIHPDRFAWIAWPKKTSGVTTDLTGDIVRATILRTNLVDVKVCAISDTWSGLKTYWRKDLR